MKLSIIIPVYNEESTIAEVIDLVNGVDLADIEKEIIVADDGSTDQSPQIIEKANEAGTATKIHTSMINLGKGAAIRFGLEYVTGDMVIIQDADLELNPNEYIQLIRPIIEGKTDVV